MITYTYALHICDSDSRASHAHTFLPEVLAFVSFGFVLASVRVLLVCFIPKLHQRPITRRASERRLLGVLFFGHALVALLGGRPAAVPVVAVG